MLHQTFSLVFLGSGCFVFGGFEVGVGLGMFELCEVVMIGTNELVLTEFTCEITDSLTVGLTGSVQFSLRVQFVVTDFAHRVDVLLGSVTFLQERMSVVL